VLDQREIAKNRNGGDFRAAWIVVENSRGDPSDPIGVGDRVDLDDLSLGKVKPMTARTSPRGRAVGRRTWEDFLAASVSSPPVPA
jgi:hypothetical protein